MTKQNRVFYTHGVDDPEAWDCDVAEYMSCIEAYDGHEVTRYDCDEQGYYDVYFEDGHYIPGVAGFHLYPEPTGEEESYTDREIYLDF